VDEGVVLKLLLAVDWYCENNYLMGTHEAGENAGNAKDEFAFTDLGAERDVLLWALDLLLWSHDEWICGLVGGSEVAKESWWSLEGRFCGVGAIPKVRARKRSPGLGVQTKSLTCDFSSLSVKQQPSPAGTV
jgi:hypothetical protein